MKNDFTLFIVTRFHPLKKNQIKTDLPPYTQDNLQVLATEMFKVYKNLSPTTAAEIFRARVGLIQFIFFFNQFFLT